MRLPLMLAGTCRLRLHLPLNTIGNDTKWHRYHPAKGLFSLLVPVRAYAEDRFKPDEGAYQLIFVAGKIAYYDGFPDDDRQEWSFCFQSVYHLALNRIVFAFCDPEPVIPQMEARD